MIAFRIWLVMLLIAVGGYTIAVSLTQGMNLLPVFFGAMGTLTWQGQFNADFLGMLSLSAIWVAWRHRFTPVGLLLGLLALNLGVLFLAVYLLVQSFRAANGAALLTGDRHVDGVRA